MNEVAPGVARLPTAVVNVYFVGEPAAPWVLVDAGVPGQAAKIKAAAEARYGLGAKPAAVILTHGHFDHVGSLADLVREWNVPVYAHHLEMPYLRGESLYAPFDPTVGGFFAFLTRFLPRDSYDSADHLHDLPADGSLTSMPGWEWFHTPGHSPGHVSLWRKSDRTLIAGDAFVTVDMSKFTHLLTQKPELTPPPTPATPDWAAARESVSRLAGLGPFTVATGHGTPLSGPNVARDLRAFAERFPMPRAWPVRHRTRPRRRQRRGLPPPARSRPAAQAVGRRRECPRRRHSGAGR